MKMHILRRCPTCGTVYAFERGPDLKNAPQTCTRIARVRNTEEGVECEECKGVLENANV